MAIFLQDDFESYPLGSHPSSWVSPPWDVPPSTGTVVAGSPDGVGTQAFLLGLLQHTELTAIDAFSCRFSFNLGNHGSNLAFGIGILQCQLGTGGYQVFSIGMNADSTIFCQVLADPFTHTSTYAGSTMTALHFETWYDIIANAVFSTYVSGGVTFIQVQVNIAIDGIQEIDVLVKTNAKLSDVGTLGATRWIFAAGAINGSVIDEIVCQTGGGAISPPVATLPANVYQEVAELLQIGNPNANVYQLVVEILHGPAAPPPSPLTLACPVNGGQAFLGVFYSAQLVVTTT